MSDAPLSQSRAEVRAATLAARLLAREDRGARRPSPESRVEWRVVRGDGTEACFLYDAGHAQDALADCRMIDAAAGPYRLECRTVTVGPWEREEQE